MMYVLRLIKTTSIHLNCQEIFLYTIYSILLLGFRRVWSHLTIDTNKIVPIISFAPPTRCAHSTIVYIAMSFNCK